MSSQSVSGHTELENESHAREICTDQFQNSVTISRWSPPTNIIAAEKWLRDASAAVALNENQTLREIRDALSHDLTPAGFSLQGEVGGTLLHAACSLGLLPPLPLLQAIHAACPAAADAADTAGRRPLHRLAAAHPSAAAAVGWLSAVHPPAAVAQDSAGQCPLHCLARSYDAAEAAACDRSLAGPPPAPPPPVPKLPLPRPPFTPILSFERALLHSLIVFVPREDCQASRTPPLLSHLRALT